MDAAERAARRARREAKRERQRAQSVDRAKEMHAARLAHEREGAVANGPHFPDDPAAFVGCSGWFYWHWRDAFYPPGTKTSGWFEHYARTFRTVELNAPFYSWPKMSTVQGWARQAGRRKFIYTVKVSELITHVKRFAGTARLVRDFYHIADLLGPRMGCFLFQLPPSFHYTRARLDRIVRQLDPARRNVVEFRHRSWWNEAVYAAFREKGIIFCSCSGPRLPDELIKTADELYVRFHGTKQWYRHDYSPEELAVWAERIRSSGATRAWVYFNNDRNCYAIKNAKELIRQLKRLRRRSAAPADDAAAGAAAPARRRSRRVAARR
jgi:uncharacterized protein YecE (DUF72 family)